MSTTNDPALNYFICEKCCKVLSSKAEYEQHKESSACVIQMNHGIGINYTAPPPTELNQFALGNFLPVLNCMCCAETFLNPSKLLYHEFGLYMKVSGELTRLKEQKLEELRKQIGQTYQAQQPDIKQLKEELQIGQEILEKQTQQDNQFQPQQKVHTPWPQYQLTPELWQDYQRGQQIIQQWQKEQLPSLLSQGFLQPQTLPPVQSEIPTPATTLPSSVTSSILPSIYHGWAVKPSLWL